MKFNLQFYSAFTILMAIWVFGLIDYENQIRDLQNTSINDKLYYQYQLDSLRAEIECLQQYQYQDDIEDSYDDIINALIQVESNGNDSAHHVLEDAVGALQIRRTMVRDVNRILKRRGSREKYKLKDRWDRQKSIEMFNIYSSHYKLNTPEEMARCWNGGPKGTSKTATIVYWNKVKNHLDS